jgi:hypothetical protein
VKLRIFAALVIVVCVGALFFGCGERRADKEYQRIFAKEKAGGPLKLLIGEYQALVDKFPRTKAAGRAQARMFALQLKLDQEVLQQKALLEYTRIFEKESGGQLRLLVDQYYDLIKRYPDTKAAGMAQERMTALILEWEEQQGRQRAETAVVEAQPKVLAEQTESSHTLNTESKALDFTDDRPLSLKNARPELVAAERERQIGILRLVMFQAAKGRARVLHPNYEVTEVIPVTAEALTTGDDGKSFSLQRSYRVDLMGGLLGVDKKSVLLDCAGMSRYDERDDQFEVPKITKCQPAAQQ